MRGNRFFNFRQMGKSRKNPIGNAGRKKRSLKIRGGTRATAVVAAIAARVLVPAKAVVAMPRAIADRVTQVVVIATRVTAVIAARAIECIFRTNGRGAVSKD